MYEKFVNLYPVSKTLRFELIPQGKTLENMKKNDIINDDEQKAIKYKRAKELIDEYHKKFIEESLKNYKIDKALLEEYNKIADDKNKDKNEFDKVKGKLRKEISEVFTKNESYKLLFGKEMINDYLPLIIKNAEDKDVITEFSKFTTYFSGFNENRKNMYSAEEKSTAIAYRIINENLPMFIANMRNYEYIQQVLSEEVISKIYNELEEIMQVENLKEMFELKYFNEVLTQKGIDIYNNVIGGFSKEDGKKVKGINEYINEYKQKNPNDRKISKMNILYKQILTDCETASFVIDSIDDDKEVVNILNDLSINMTENIMNNKSNLEELLKNIDKYDLEKIYIKNDLSLTEISQYLYDDWGIITHEISNQYDKEFEGAFKKMKSEKYEENKKKYLKSKKNLSIIYTNECTKRNDKYKGVQEYFKESCIKDEKGNKINIFENIDKTYKNIEDLLKSGYPTNKNLKQDVENIEKIKEYLDALKKVEKFIKPLINARYDLEIEKDNKFYDELIKYWNVLQSVTPIYNKVRNYLTGKPYSTNKIKLNFNNPTLLDGWDVNKEKDNSSILLRKDNLYYLAIFDRKFDGELERKENSTDSYFEKIEYKLLPGPNKMLPKVFFSNKNIDLYNPSKELIENYKKGMHKKGENFDIKFCHELIDFFKQSIEKQNDWKKFNFSFTDTNSYNDISEFYKEVEQQGYKITYSKVEKQYIEDLVEKGKIYLFKIYNKDFSEYSHGKPNLHTLYWKMLFDNQNLENVVYKLNGEAEIFYRKASMQRNITHKRNEKINNKNPNNPTKQSEFEYDLIKDKRFTEDKFQFHVPITLNFKNVGISRINEVANREIKENKENYIIGIDRGERHLLYLVLINSKGKIVEQYSLNNIENEKDGVTYKTDYHKLLDYKEKEREKARESWQSIENIKELKEGYLSQVITKITDLMIKYNAILVLEDLNFGFMRGRQKVEKQVYQKFEKMLIDKLNYLVKKDKNIGENGGLLKAYQLTNKFESFKKLGKQSGMLYYIPAWNTSKMDPVTGFVNLFYIKYENEEKSKEFTKKINSIKYNEQNKYFEFDIDYNNFTSKAEGTRTRWTLCTFGNRIVTFRNPNKNNQWDNEEIELTSEFKKLFKKYEIEYENKDIKDEILKISGKDFWEKFINLFKLMLQMRNSITGDTKDYIISPVSNSNGQFFNSENKNEELPKDADANGAYNIARKGLWIINQIKNTPNDKLKNIKLAVSNKEWLNFIQDRG